MILWPPFQRENVSVSWDACTCSDRHIFIEGPAERYIEVQKCCWIPIAGSSECASAVWCLMPERCKSPSSNYSKHNCQWSAVPDSSVKSWINARRCYPALFGHVLILLPFHEVSHRISHYINLESKYWGRWYDVIVIGFWTDISQSFLFFPFVQL